MSDFPGTSGWQVGIWFHDEGGDPNEARVPNQAEQEEALHAIGGKLDWIEWDNGEPIVTVATLPEDMAREVWYGGYASATAQVSNGRITVEVEMP